MANLTRFEPLGSEMSRLDPFRLDPFRDFDNMFRSFMLRPMLQGAMDGGGTMRLDVLEDDKSYTVLADIPGCKKENIHIAVDGNQISITAEMKKAEEEKPNGRRMVYSERCHGQWERSFTLDKDVEMAGAKAKYTDGVLEAILPKKEAGSAKQIAIS